MSYEAFYATGKYKGDGTADRLISVGFKPVVLMIMGNSSKFLLASRAKKNKEAEKDNFWADEVANNSQYITFVDNGFLLDVNSTGVNTSGEWFYYIALKDSTGLFNGSYTGDGGTSRLILTGKKPAFIFTVNSKADLTIRLDNYSPGDYDHIKLNYARSGSTGPVFTEQGFIVDGTSGLWNDNLELYSYFGLFEGDVPMFVSSSIGNGSGNIYIHTGVRPRFLFGTSRDGSLSDRAIWKTKDMPTEGDNLIVVNNPATDWAWSTAPNNNVIFTDRAVEGGSLNFNRDTVSHFLIFS